MYDKMMMVTKEEFEEAEKYWLDKFSDGTDEIRLSKSRKNDSRHTKDSLPVDIEGKLSEELLKISKGQDLLLYIILTAAMKIVLFEYTGQSVITIGSPLYSSSGEGYDYNTCVALKDCLEDEMTFKELLLEVRKTVVDAYKNQYYPLDNIIDFLSRNNYNPSLLNIILSLESIHNSKHINEIINSERNEITVSFRKNGDKLGAHIFYDSSGFKEYEVLSLWRCFIEVLGQVIKNTNIKLCNIELIPGSEKDRILYGFNDTSFECPHRKTIGELFEEQAADLPEHTAVEMENGSITYRELNEKANCWARILRENGIKRGSVVGIIMEYSFELVIGILSVLKAGGAYLPIDPEYPPERISYMLEDSQASVLLTHKKLTEGELYRKHIKNGIKVITLDDRPPGGIDKSNLDSGCTARDLAYIIYTSGSTGVPKGVMVEHRSIVNLTGWRIKQYGYSSKDKILQLISISFDGFGADFYSSLLSGATLVLPDSVKRRDFNYIDRLIKNAGVSSMSVVPAMYREIIRNADADQLKSVRIVILAGERTEEQLVEMSGRIAPWIVLVNEYGPTENTITTTSFMGMRRENPDIIGKPVANNKVYVLGRNNKLMPVGVPGELCISGMGLARGYLGKQDFTMERFVENPFSPGEKMYKTGDKARWLPDGNIEYLGRMDNQVKVYGFRIEPEEVERAITRQGLVKEAVVAVREDRHKSRFLCAYIVADSNDVVPKLRTCLENELPDYMVPSRFVIIDKLPLTPNGKVNRTALPDPGENNAEKQEYVEPRGSIEKNLAAIWEKVLNVRHIGTNDNFFQAGGNSILLMQVHSQIEKLYPGRVSIPNLFSYPTISKLAKYLENNETEPDKYILKTVIFPDDYLAYGLQTKDPGIYKFEISGELYGLAEKICKAECVHIHDVLISAYICLLARVSKQKDITVQTITEENDRVIPVNANIEELWDLRELYKLVSERRKNPGADSYRMSETGRIKMNADKALIVPLYCTRNTADFAHGIKGLYDIIFEADEYDDRVSFTCEYKTFKLKANKMEEFARMYTKLVNFLTSRDLAERR